MRKNTTKIERGIVWLPILIFILSGCTKETILSQAGKEECLISFEFSIPSLAEHSRATAKLTNENAISDIYVFAFESGSDKLKDWAEAEVVSASGSVTTGTVKLSTAANGGGTHKLVFLANVKSEILAALSAGTIVADMDYQTFQPVLTTDIGSILTADPTAGFLFPMWGETEYISLSSTLELTGTNAVALQRALAKIDVAVNRQTDGTTPGLTNFILTGVMVYNINYNAVVIPDPSNVGNDQLVVYPTIGNTELKNVIRNTPETSGCLSSIYVPETVNSISTEYPPYLIIQGIYLGNDPQNTDDTYYRIDFISEKSDSQRQHLLRNNSYTFNIKQVNQEGYATIEEAIDNAGLSYDLFTVSEYNNANDLYSIFCYNNLGYIALMNEREICTYPQGYETSFSFKAQFKDDMDPAVDGYFCTAEGDMVISQNLEASIDHTIKSVQLKTLVDNRSDETIVQYYKVFVVDDPDICLIVQLDHLPFVFSNIMGGIRSDNTQYTLVAGNASQYYVLFYGPIPASKYRITREGGYTVEVNHPHVVNGQGVSDGFSLPVNDSPNYLNLKVEWLHPWTGEWLLYKDTEQVGVNYRVDVSGVPLVYVAQNDAPSWLGTSIYTGISWSEALGISSTYNTTQFSTSAEYNGGKYTPTYTSTGCGAYYEGDIDDPITGWGKWRAPTGSEYTSLRLYINSTSGYFGISPGIVDRNGTYITSTDNSATNFNSYRVTTSTATSTLKTNATNSRIRCVRDVQ